MHSVVANFEGMPIPGTPISVEVAAGVMSPLATRVMGVTKEGLSSETRLQAKQAYFTECQ